MQLRQLFYFSKIVESGSFSKASQELFVSQPTLSQSILAFENELGFELLVRTSSGVFPTEMGKTVYADAKRIIKSADDAFENWKQTDRERKQLNGIVKLVAYPSSYTFVEKVIISRAKKIYPNIKWQLLEARGSDVPGIFTKQQADLAVGDFVLAEENSFLEGCKNNGLFVRALFRDTCKIAVSKNNPLSAKTDLNSDDIKGLSLAYYSGGDDVADPHFTRFFNDKLSIEFHSFEKIVESTVNDIAVSPLAEAMFSKTWMVQTGSVPVTFHTIRDFSLPVEHCLIYPQNSSLTAEVETIKKLIIEEYEKLAPRYTSPHTCI